MTDSAFDPRALAAKLRSLRNAGKQASTAEFPLPGDHRQAMDAQNFLSAEEGIRSNAWKVAMPADNQPVTAPLHPYVEAVSGAKLPWVAGMKYEAEIAVRLGKDLPIRSGGKYTRAEIADAVADAYLGVELSWTAVAEGNKISPLLFLADRLANLGYVLGPVLPRSILDTCTGTPLKVTLNGQPIYDATAQHVKVDVLTWLVDYANDTFRPDSSLRSGAVITTGSLCGAIELASGGELDTTLGGAKMHLSLTQ